MIRALRVSTALAGLALAALIPRPVVAQGRGGGRGAGGGTPSADTRSRMEILSDTFTLDKDQKKEMKATLDDAYKAAAPIRAQLRSARSALYAAVQAGKPEDIDRAIDAYAAQATAMADAEMKALAHVLAPLRADQRAQGTMGAFYLMRGFFLDDKKWDEMPKVREY